MSELTHSTPRSWSARAPTLGTSGVERTHGEENASNIDQVSGKVGERFRSGHGPFRSSARRLLGIYSALARVLTWAAFKHRNTGSTREVTLSCAFAVISRVTKSVDRRLSPSRFFGLALDSTPCRRPVLRMIDSDSSRRRDAGCTDSRRKWRLEVHSRPPRASSDEHRWDRYAVSRGA